MSGFTKQQVQAHIRRIEKLIQVFSSAQSVRTSIKGKQLSGYKMQLGKNQVLFDIRTWGTDIAMEDSVTAEKTGCGTAACVLGTAGLIPEFRKAGLRTDKAGENVDMIDKSGEVISDGEEAFAMFFGSTETEAMGICMPDSYNEFSNPVDSGGLNIPIESTVRPKAVVAKLKKLLARKNQELKYLY